MTSLVFPGRLCCSLPSSALDGSAAVTAPIAHPSISAAFSFRVSRFLFVQKVFRMIVSGRDFATRDAPDNGT